eukprot:1147787-Pelagomonas_calceolata.AAC.5
MLSPGPHYTDQEKEQAQKSTPRHAKEHGVTRKLRELKQKSSPSKIAFSTSYGPESYTLITHASTLSASQPLKNKQPWAPYWRFPPLHCFKLFFLPHLIRSSASRSPVSIDSTSTSPSSEAYAKYLLSWLMDKDRTGWSMWAHVRVLTTSSRSHKVTVASAPPVARGKNKCKEQFVLGSSRTDLGQRGQCGTSKRTA